MSLGYICAFQLRGDLSDCSGFVPQALRNKLRRGTTTVLMEKKTMKKLALYLASLAVMLLSGHALSQPVSPMDTINLMAQMVSDYDGKSICAKSAKVMELAQALHNYSTAHPEKGDRLSQKDIYISLIERFPCPFNPKQAPVRRATNTDLFGYWELVPESIRIKTNLFRKDPFPSNCQYFFFSEDRDMRSIDMIVNDACPSVTVTDFKAAKALPKVIDWKVESSGNLEITRTDIPNYIESWDVFIATTSFTQSGVTFKPGDLLLFMAQFGQTKRDGLGTLYFRQFRKFAGS